MEPTEKQLNDELEAKIAEAKGFGECVFSVSYRDADTKKVHCFVQRRRFPSSDFPVVVSLIRRNLDDTDVKVRE